MNFSKNTAVKKNILLILVYIVVLLILNLFSANACYAAETIAPEHWPEIEQKLIGRWSRQSAKKIICWSQMGSIDILEFFPNHTCTLNSSNEKFRSSWFLVLADKISFNNNQFLKRIDGTLKIEQDGDNLLLIPELLISNTPKDKEQFLHNKYNCLENLDYHRSFMKMKY